MRDHDYYEYDEDPWAGVRLTKEAIRARAIFILYAALASAPSSPWWPQAPSSVD